MSVGRGRETRRVAIRALALCVSSRRKGPLLCAVCEGKRVMETGVGLGTVCALKFCFRFLGRGRRAENARREGC